MIFVILYNTINIILYIIMYKFICTFFETPRGFKAVFESWNKLFDIKYHVKTYSI